MTTKNDTAFNDGSLIAWNEWKKICSVANCGEKHRNILSKEIYSAFKKKFETISDDFADRIMKEPVAGRQNIHEEEEKGYSWEKSVKDDRDDIDCSADDDDEDDIEEQKKSAPGEAVAPVNREYWKDLSHFWTHEFDIGILFKANAAPDADNADEEGRQLNGDIWKGTAKDYKDYTWHKLANSNDAPLKVIRGILIGPRGIINAIGESYLYANHRDVWENYQEERRNKKRTLSKKEHIENIRVISIDQPLSSNGDGEDQRSLGDKIASPAIGAWAAPTRSESLKEAEELLEQFSTWELALILAKGAGVLAARETETFLKAGRTKIYNYWNNNLEKKACANMTLFAKKSVLFVMKKRIETEEGGKLFLSVIRKALKEKKNMGELL